VRPFSSRFEVEMNHPLPGNALLLEVGHELMKVVGLPCAAGADDDDDFGQIRWDVEGPAPEFRQGAPMKISDDSFSHRLHTRKIYGNPFLNPRKI